METRHLERDDFVLFDGFDDSEGAGVVPRRFSLSWTADGWWLVESGGTALFWFKDFFTIKKGRWLSESREL
jgi:hypothetical protein